jgi:hypothetical protein
MALAKACLSQSRAVVDDPFRTARYVRLVHRSSSNPLSQEGIAAARRERFGARLGIRVAVVRRLSLVPKAPR